MVVVDFDKEWEQEINSRLLGRIEAIAKALENAEWTVGGMYNETLKGSAIGGRDLTEKESEAIDSFRNMLVELQKLKATLPKIEEESS